MSILNCAISLAILGASCALQIPPKDIIAPKEVATALSVRIEPRLNEPTAYKLGEQANRHSPGNVVSVRSDALAEGVTLVVSLYSGQVGEWEVAITWDTPSDPVVGRVRHRGHLDHGVWHEWRDVQGVVVVNRWPVVGDAYNASFFLWGCEDGTVEVMSESVTIEPVSSRITK